MGAAYCWLETKNRLESTAAQIDASGAAVLILIGCLLIFYVLFYFLDVDRKSSLVYTIDNMSSVAG